MQSQSHIFNPQDNTFDERIRSYKSVLNAYRNMESSLDYMNEREWSDRLGSSEEISEAQVIVDNSLKIAIDSIQPSEIQEAEAKGLLSSEDLRLIEQIERQQEIQKSREEKQQFSNKQSSFKFRQ